MLKVNEDLPISYASFLEKCRENMTKNDYSDVLKATFSSEGEAKNPLMKKWQDYYRFVNGELKEERLKKLGWSEEIKAEIKKDPVLSERLKRAVNSMNPLEGEKEMLNIYFDFLSSNESLDPFDTDYLMIYALKIQIIERLNSFDSEKGRKEFSRLFKNIQDQFN